MGITASSDDHYFILKLLLHDLLVLTKSSSDYHYITVSKDLHDDHHIVSMANKAFFCDHIFVHIKKYKSQYPNRIYLDLFVVLGHVQQPGSYCDG